MYGSGDPLLVWFVNLRIEKPESCWVVFYGDAQDGDWMCCDLNVEERFSPHPIDDRVNTWSESEQVNPLESSETWLKLSYFSWDHMTIRFKLLYTQLRFSIPLWSDIHLSEMTSDRVLVFKGDYKYLNWLPMISLRLNSYVLYMYPSKAFLGL